MRFLRLWSFRSEGGSAVSEFVMVVVPVTLIIMTLLSFFGVAFSSLMIKQKLYEATRFAALADVSPSEANIYAESQVTGSQITKISLPTGCLLIGSKTEYFPLAGFLPPLEITIRGVSTCEVP